MAPVGTLAPVKSTENERQEIENEGTLVGSVTQNHRKVKGAAKSRGVHKDKRTPNQQLTHDQVYLLGRINDATPQAAQLTVAAVQQLNCRYGLSTVVSSMRVLHGSPPPGVIHKLYPYLETMCKGDA